MNFLLKWCQETCYLSWNLMFFFLINVVIEPVQSKKLLCPSKKKKSPLSLLISVYQVKCSFKSSTTYFLACLYQYLILSLNPSAFPFFPLTYIAKHQLVLIPSLINNSSSKASLCTDLDSHISHICTNHTFVL